MITLTFPLEQLQVSTFPHSEYHLIVLLQRKQDSFNLNKTARKCASKKELVQVQLKKKTQETASMSYFLKEKRKKANYKSSEKLQEYGLTSVQNRI